MELALPVREAVVTRLTTSPGVTAHVPAVSVFGERVPPDRTFPFIRLGAPILTPNRMTCWNGETVGLTVHAFVKGVGSDAALLAGAAIKLELDGIALPIDDAGGTVDVTWTGGQLFADPEEPDLWHVVQTFDAG